MTLQYQPQENVQMNVFQMNIFSIFAALISLIGIIYELIKINNEYGGFKAVFSNTPQGRLIKRWDIPYLNVYFNIQVEINGIWQWAGHFWF